jgi:hypothetical protein
MHDYTVAFIEPVEPHELAQAASEAFDIPLDHIEIWDGTDFVAPVTEPVIAQVAVGSEEGVYAEFTGFDAFAEHTGTPERIAVAIELATRLKKRALLSPDSAEDYLWTLVTADGSHGKVVLDSDKLDEGTVELLGTSKPIDDTRVSDS